MLRQFELVERVKAYDPSADEDAIVRAYIYAMKMHGTQKRASGDPYFLHPLEVASILIQLRLDVSSVVTALLHDTVEDTLATLEEVKILFGSEVARLVDGVTKLTRLQLQSTKTKQAENFRKLLIAMSEDIRVLLVKLADRLHNMRTLHFIHDPGKRQRIALETMEIYAPLAERIGMHEIKNDLENSAFAELHPDAWHAITARLEFLRELDNCMTIRIINKLRETLNKNGISAICSGREKPPHSIWRKMQRKNVSFDQLSDIMAFRVVVASVEECYYALGTIHSHYPVVPGRFKDYISTPKPNGYRSLHTGIIGPEQHHIEVQIRTQAMHDINELGVAAHWRYKQEIKSVDGRQYHWLQGLLEILEHTSGAEEFLDNTKLEMFQDQAFCFTPRGDLINLPNKATPVDFAYAVHTTLGDMCVGAKVNGRLRPLQTHLQSGDQVEIITAKTQTPSPEWESFIVTGKARSRIRRFIHTQTYAQNVSLGMVILQHISYQNGFQHIADKLEERLEVITEKFCVLTLSDLYVLIGRGVLSGWDIIKVLYPEFQVWKPHSIIPTNPTNCNNKPQCGNSIISIENLISGIAIHYSKCCSPLLGDRIIGIMTPGKGLIIHTVDCNLLERYRSQLDQWIDLAWGNSTIGTHIGRVNLVIVNKSGALGVLSTVIARNRGNILNLQITRRTTDFFTILIDIAVQNMQHLIDIIAALRITSVVCSVEQVHAQNVRLPRVTCEN